MSNEQELWARIKENTYCDPSRRMDFVLLFDVKDGNPNGDPDAGNLPRMDPTNQHGIVTDVCIKRKVRDYLASVLGRRIYIQSTDALNTLYFRAAREISAYDAEQEATEDDEQKRLRKEDKEAVESLLAELDECDSNEFGELIVTPDDDALANNANKKRRDFREWLARAAGEIAGLDFDPEAGTLRYLGEAKSKNDFQKLLLEQHLESDDFKDDIGKLANLLQKAKPSKTTKQRKAREAIKAKMWNEYDDIRLFGAVLTAGTNAGQIRGPMQLTFARSVEPILQQDAAITRCAVTKESDRARKETEFGRKAWLSYAAYRQHGFFNPLLAKQTGLERDDLARFWEALACMFRNAASASKGEMATQDLVVFVHSNSRGNAPSHKLFDRVKPNAGNGNGELLKVEDQENIKKHGVEIHRPLKDMWPDL